MKKVRVEDVVVQTIVSLINLGGRKAGLAPGAEDEKDLDQLREAIEAVRALMPLAESSLGPDAPQVHEALSQLQLAYAQERQGAPAAAAMSDIVISDQGRCSSWSRAAPNRVWRSSSRAASG